jgi:hypothetical protein
MADAAVEPIEKVMQVSIDDALKESAPMFEGMARDHIPVLVQRLLLDVDAAGWAIVPKASVNKPKV